MAINGICECGCGGKTSIARQSHTKSGWVRGQPLRFIYGHNLGKGDKHYRWRGGSRKGGRYPGTLQPEHPNAEASGYVKNHILTATQALGKEMPRNAVVHHHDYSSGQLVICENQRYHLLIHRRTRALRACGHADWLKCPICKVYDDPSNLKIWRNANNTKSFGVHAACRQIQNRKRYHKPVSEAESPTRR